MPNIGSEFFIKAILTVNSPFLFPLKSAYNKSILFKN